MKNKILKTMAVCMMAVLLAGCGSSDQAKETSGGQKEAGQEQNADGEAATLNLAYQYGVAYAPLSIVKEQELIEKA